MGEVYRARDTKLARDVALKVLPDAFADDPERLAGFRREAQILASLGHPNIAQVFGLEEGPVCAVSDATAPMEAGRYVRALVMELIEGPTLADLVAQEQHDSVTDRKPEAQNLRPEAGLPLRDVTLIAMQIGMALMVAHAKGVIHRDLKPANIKLMPEGRFVKVLDFGLAKVLDARGPSGISQTGREIAASQSTTLSTAATRHGVILGTAAYMSPEQARGENVDERADIWAFGVVIYELPTGRRLFQGNDVSETLAQVLTKEPDWEPVPEGVRPILHACLEKNPEQRTRQIDDVTKPLVEAWVQSTPLSPRMLDFWRKRLE